MNKLEAVAHIVSVNDTYIVKDIERTCIGYDEIQVIKLYLNREGIDIGCLYKCEHGYFTLTGDEYTRDFLEFYKLKT